MTITIQKTQEVVIGLPSFTKNSTTYFACINENNVIAISRYEVSKTARICGTSSLVAAYTDTTTITKEEFNEAYQATIDRLYDDMEQNIAAINLMCEDGAEASDPAMDEMKREQLQQTQP